MLRATRIVFKENGNDTEPRWFRIVRTFIQFLESIAVANNTNAAVIVQRMYLSGISALLQTACDSAGGSVTDQGPMSKTPVLQDEDLHGTSSTKIVRTLLAR